jgi:flagellar basal body-associated protein FliL
VNINLIVAMVLFCIGLCFLCFLSSSSSSSSATAGTGNVSVVAGAADEEEDVVAGAADEEDVGVEEEVELIGDDDEAPDLTWAQQVEISAHSDSEVD